MLVATDLNFNCSRDKIFWLHELGRHERPFFVSSRLPSQNFLGNAVRSVPCTSYILDWWRRRVKNLDVIILKSVWLKPGDKQTNANEIKI